MERSQPSQAAATHPRGAGSRAALIIRRGRMPLHMAMGLVGAIAIAIPIHLGVPSLAAAGLLVLIALAVSLRAIDRGVDAFRLSANLVYGLALAAVAWAVLGLGLSPVIAVYFPALVLLASAYLLGARAAVLWALPSVALVAATVWFPAENPREVNDTVTFLVRAGTLLAVLGFAVSFRRSHDRQARELVRLAMTDALTGLANRGELDRALAKALDRSRRFGRRGALVFIDIDGMKGVNDTLGHSCGDAYLRLIADRIRGITRGVDTPARLGGDEFVVLLSEFDDEKGAEIYARKLLATLCAPCALGGQAITPSASLGIASFPSGAESADDLLRFADAAMYEAKRAGGRRIFRADAEGCSEVR